MTSTEMQSKGSEPDYDRKKELQEFVNTKSGVKGLVDGGMNTLPKMFIRPPEELLEDLTTQNDGTLKVPIIDLAGIDTPDSRAKIVEEIRVASEKWGFFQIINHGVPEDVLEKTIEQAKMFHEQDVEVKKEYYAFGGVTQVGYFSNFDLYKSKAANWRDTLSVYTAFTGHLDPQNLPPICRDAILDHINNILKLGGILLELLSEALGLRPDYLKEMGCDTNWASVYHYYPACPQPELTLGITKHTDTSFLTMLLQDHIGGLQVFHQNKWVDVPPLPGSLVINIGDLLQMVTNNKLVSVWHRVKANHVGPRISSAFFLSGVSATPKVYGPIPELISDENPAIYREFTVAEYIKHFYSRPLEVPGVQHFTIKNRDLGN